MRAAPMTHTSRRLAIITGALAIHLAVAGSAAAQDAPAAQDARPVAAATRGVTLRIASGAFIPTGSQRALLKDAKVAAAQLAWRLRAPLALNATLAWARSRDAASIDNPRLDVFTADVGVESRVAAWCQACAVSLEGFTGVGTGIRRLDHHAGAQRASDHAAGYLAAGGELGIRRVALRLEVRDYLSDGAEPATVGRSALRNDVAVMLTMRFNRKVR